MNQCFVNSSRRMTSTHPIVLSPLFFFYGHEAEPLFSRLWHQSSTVRQVNHTLLPRNFLLERGEFVFHLPFHFHVEEFLLYLGSCVINLGHCFSPGFNLCHLVFHAGKVRMSIEAILEVRQGCIHIL